MRSKGQDRPRETESERGVDQESFFFSETISKRIWCVGGVEESAGVNGVPSSGER